MRVLVLVTAVFSNRTDASLTVPQNSRDRLALSAANGQSRRHCPHTGTSARTQRILPS